MRFTRHIFIKLACSFLLLGGLWFSQAAYAQSGPDTGLNFAAQSGLSAVDPRVVVTRVIRTGLGLLGIVAIALLIYAGYLWMNARGDEEKIDKAKKILKGGIIGLIIIISAFAIVSFILSRLLQSSGGGGSGGVCSPACSSGQYCCNGSCQATQCGILGGGLDLFTVRSTAPAHQSIDVPRNAIIRFQFSKNVQPSSVTPQSFVVTTAGGDVEGNGTVINDIIEFVPSYACEAPNNERKCFPKNTTIIAEAKNPANGIISVDGKVLSCGGNSRCLISFTTGDYVDTSAPRVNLLTQQICAASENILHANAIDDYGVSKINFFADDNNLGGNVNSNPSPGGSFDTILKWQTNNYTVGQNILLKASAYDLDSNNATAQKNLRVSATHCCNGVIDGDETGTDCGGSCLACDGQSCKQSGGGSVCSDNACASGYCGLNDCLCTTRPRIDSITPAGGFCSNNIEKICNVNSDCNGGICDMVTPNGSNGNFITITGSGFGTQRGRVAFMGASGEIEAQLADNSKEGNPVCSEKVWTDTQIIAVVPVAAVKGPILVGTKGNIIDRSNDGYGSLINDFVRNSISRAGICAVSPNSAKQDQILQYDGIKFTDSQAYFGSLVQKVGPIGAPFESNTSGTVATPNLESGQTTTYLIGRNKTHSNFIAFTKENEAYSGPIISSIEPVSGPIGQYVTIRGAGFGSSRGTSKVFFGDSSGIEADYAFPDVCSQSIWSDKQIIIKVPSGVTNTKSYPLTVSRVGFLPVKSDQLFQVTTGGPNPGLCRIDPSLGQPNSAVTLYGEYFKDKDTNSAVRFHDNQIQSGNSLTFWAIDQSAGGIKPWKVVTTVPQSAATGAVQISAGTPAQLSNSVLFGVGSCSQDADCGSGATCCAAGLPEAGKCKADASQCYGTVATSVYQWRFSTSLTGPSCQGDQSACGQYCCLPGKCDATGKVPVCSECRGQNQCGDNKCCNLACVMGSDNQSHCPDPPSCAGYNGNQCVEGYICPNVPGSCSPTPPTGGQTITGDCGAPACNAKPGCENESCTYNATLNRCVKNGLAACSLKSLIDSDRNIIKVNNVPVTGVCASYNNQPRWQIDMQSSCPSGWTRLPNNKCIDATGRNPACSLCGSGQSCIPNNDKGTCVVGDSVCAAGSTCNLADNKCKTSANATCACCCRKDRAQQDCCAGLTCAGTCGSGSANLGMCGGCAVRNGNGQIQQDESDAKCECVGHTGQYCSVTAATPTGVCSDCSSITDPVACSQHTQCCVDAKNNNKCTSLIDGQPRVPGSLTTNDSGSLTTNEFGRTTGYEVAGPTGNGGGDKNGNGDDNGNGNNDPLQFCGYFSCTRGNPNLCATTAMKDGTYPLFDTCEQRCPLDPTPCSDNPTTCSNAHCAAGYTCNMAICQCIKVTPPPGDSCHNPITGNCSLTCSVGYQCLTPTTGRPGKDDTCRCCCKPPAPGETDTCKLMDPSLNCIANQDSCTGANRGACCGCSADSQCGDPAITGCGLTGNRCCRARPIVEKDVDPLKDSRKPSPNSEHVCRNPSIEARFSQLMDKASFSTGSDGSPNVLLIGDYGTTSCPSGSELIASAAPTGRLANLVYGLKKTIAQVLPFLLTKPAFAEFSNYCIVSGTPIGTDVTTAKTKINYRLGSLLDANRRYFVVLKGDPALTDINGTHKPHYNNHITNLAKIGLNALGVNRLPNVPAVFNHTEFKNAEIWTFKTGNEVCKLDSAKVSPSFYLFQQSGQKTLLTSGAYAINGQPIESIPDVYAWTWNWESANPEVAEVQQHPDELTVADAIGGNKQDAQTLGTATAKIVADTRFNSVGQSVQGSSQLRLFLCQNPWPVFYAYPPYPAGYTGWPWREPSTGIEFYYCRDKNGPGTADDLPALKDAPLDSGSGRKICMSGNNRGHSCTSDTDCGNASCFPEFLKEFFFFRETVPAVPVISGRVEANGEAVTLGWPAAANATKYKINYGFNPGQYTTTVDVPAPPAGPVSRTISDLINGLNYYFTVTALTIKNQESEYSNELKLKPLDTQAPALPSVRATGGDTKVALFWNPVPDAVRYIAYFGTQPRNGGQHEYATNKTISLTPTPNNPNVIFSSVLSGGLDNAATYYTSVRSVDRYGNISDYSPELQVHPNRPYLISAIGGVNSVTLNWLPFIGAQQYQIRYLIGIKPKTVTVAAGTHSTLINNLVEGTSYTFTVKALKTSNDSEESNSVVGTPCSGSSCGGSGQN